MAGAAGYRIRVKADGKMAHANDEGVSRPGWPAYVVSTKAQLDDGYNHFLIEPVAPEFAGTAATAAADPTLYTITTVASGRRWELNMTDRGIVFTAPNASDRPARFRFERPGGGGGGSSGECYAVRSPGFNPSYDPAAISGVVDWPCRADEDCSLNGRCGSNGSCQCRPAWKGRRCETLNLLPPTRGAGYRGVDGGHNTSSWGGAVLKGPDQKYHMWAAEMTEHCGIGTWQQNSRVRQVARAPLLSTPCAGNI